MAKKKKSEETPFEGLQVVIPSELPTFENHGHPPDGAFKDLGEQEILVLGQKTVVSKPQLEVMQSLIEETPPEPLAPQQNDIKLLANDLAAHTIKKDELEAQVKEINKHIKATNEKLIPLMNAQELHSFKTPSGATFYINRATRASVKDTDLAFPFLEQIGLDSLIKRTVNSMSLSSAVKECVEAGTLMLSELEYHGINVHVDESVRIRNKTAAKTY